MGLEPVLSPAPTIAQITDLPSLVEFLKAKFEEFSGGFQTLATINDVQYGLKFTENDKQYTIDFLKKSDSNPSKWQPLGVFATKKDGSKAVDNLKIIPHSEIFSALNVAEINNTFQVIKSASSSTMPKVVVPPASTPAIPTPKALEVDPSFKGICNLLTMLGLDYNPKKSTPPVAPAEGKPDDAQPVVEPLMTPTFKRWNGNNEYVEISICEGSIREGDNKPTKCKYVRVNVFKANEAGPGFKTDYSAELYELGKEQIKLYPNPVAGAVLVSPSSLADLNAFLKKFYDGKAEQPQ